MITGFHYNAEGSVLYTATGARGRTRVLCTASIEEGVPPWMMGRGTGWLTAEYQMHPRSSPKKREARDGRGKPPSGRTQEIQRLIGRALRAAVDLDAIGERTIALDCDVLEADGGTRTASITGGFVALALAIDKLTRKGALERRVIRAEVAAISVGHVDGELVTDLDYAEDSAARVDMNLVATRGGSIIEVQGTAEGEAVPRADVDRMMDLGLAGILTLTTIQREALERAGVALSALMEAAS